MVAVTGEARVTFVTVMKSLVFVSVTMRGCGSGARWIKAMRAARSWTKRFLCSSKYSRLNLLLKILPQGPTVGNSLAWGSHVLGLMGSLQVAVAVSTTFWIETDTLVNLRVSIALVVVVVTLDGVMVVVGVICLMLLMDLSRGRKVNAQ